MAIFIMAIFVWYFLYGIFVWEKPNIFCVAIFLYMVFLCVRSQLLLIYTPSGSPPFLLDTTQLITITG